MLPELPGDNRPISMSDTAKSAYERSSATFTQIK